MAGWFMEECIMLSDWTLGGRGGIWLPATWDVGERKHVYTSFFFELVPNSFTTWCPTWYSSGGQRASARRGDAGRRAHGGWRGPADTWQVRGSVGREGRLGGVALFALTAGNSRRADAGAQGPFCTGGQVVD